MSLLLFLKSTFAFLKCFCFIDPFLAMAELKIVFLLIWLNEKLRLFPLQKYKVSISSAILTFYEILKIFRLNECKKALRLPIFRYYQAETSGLFMAESR